jgi:uncharacterized protein YecE (DUF72 family)
MGVDIRVGIGGWTFPPWRGVFYPTGVRQKDELTWASRRLRVIEINTTAQSFQTPDAFARWADETPEDFVFTVKAHRLCTNRKVLAGAGDSIHRFLSQGLERLGARLGPILWQLMPTKAFDAADFAAFLALLPGEQAGLRLRHAVEVRHASFEDPRVIDLCRNHGVSLCLADSAKFPLIDAATADFTYARLMRGDDTIPTGYDDTGLDHWAGRLMARAEAGGPVFAFFINAGKTRAPAAAQALAARITGLRPDLDRPG